MIVKKQNKLGIYVGVTAVFSLTLLAQESQGVVLGNTYSVAGTIFADSGVGGGGIFVGPGSTSLTFDGTSKPIGSLPNGSPGDRMFIEESQSQTLTTITVQISMVARDAGGDLTTWVADGAVFDNDGNAGTSAVPFALSFFDLGINNGGSDPLEVTVGSNDYTFVSSEALLFATDGANFSFGSGSTDPSGPSGQFTASVGLNGGDISGPVAAIGGREIAGYGFTWTYELTPVPEPSSLLLVSFGMCSFFLRRR